MGRAALFVMLGVVLCGAAAAQEAPISADALRRSQLMEPSSVSVLDIRPAALEHTFLMRALPPFEANLKKRLVRSPKAYLRDTGLLHALLGLTNTDDVMGHPVYGASWEGFVIENVISALGPGWRTGFYRTAAGAELDLVLERGNVRVAVECKASSAPAVSKGFWTALSDLGIKRAYVAAPVRDPYPIGKGVTVISPEALAHELAV